MAGRSAFALLSCSAALLVRGQSGYPATTDPTTTTSFRAIFTVPAGTSFQFPLAVGDSDLVGIQKVYNENLMYLAA